MDYHQALIIGLRPDLAQPRRFRNDGHHLHRDRDSPGSRTERDHTYFAAVTEALGETPAILPLGPAMHVSTSSPGYRLTIRARRAGFSRALPGIMRRTKKWRRRVAISFTPRTGCCHIQAHTEACRRVHHPSGKPGRTGPATAAGRLSRRQTPTLQPGCGHRRRPPRSHNSARPAFGAGIQHPNPWRS